MDHEVLMEAMRLEGTDQFLQDSPEAPIQVKDQSGQMVEVDPDMMAAEGMRFAAKYMAKNGPARPIHLGRATTMTKAQLEQQIENEKQGYPSNMEEAGKIQELESKMEEMSVGIGQILSRLSGQSSPEKLEQSVQTGGSPASLAGVLIVTPDRSGTVIQPSPPSIVSSESSEPESRQPKLRQVTLKSGRVISVPQTSNQAMNLGPATDQESPTTRVEEALESAGDLSGDEWDDDPIAVVPEQEKLPVADPKVKQVMQLVQDVNQFLQANDVHRFWRRTLSANMHRHVGYSGWPKGLQVEFDKRFQGFLSDPTFVSATCRKMIGMEMGYALGVKKAASFLVAVAGYTAFALCGLD